MPTQTIEQNLPSDQDRSSWWNKLVAIVAIVNLLLVLFNLSYLPFRDVYLQHIPSLVRLYDPVKGIEPHPDTAEYISTADRLKKQLTSEGLEAASTAELFASLRQQSAELIAENPFLDANKLSTFAQLKRRIEYHLQNRSAKQALANFWSQDYFAQVGTPAAFSFFDNKIRPLLETNYFRQTDENGVFVDRFWLIDLGFAVFFGLEFLRGTFQLSRHQNLSWGNAMWRHWYDLLLLLPIWRWLRIIPVFTRVYQSKLVNLEPIVAQITYEPAAYLGDRISTFMLVRLVNQTKEAVETGAVARQLLEPKPEYIDVGNANEIDLIADRLLQLSIYKVLPQVQPNLEALLRHALKEALKESNLYQGLQQVPGIQELPLEVTENLADYLAQAAYEVLAGSYSDVQGRALLDELTQNFRRSLSKELQNKVVQAELQSLLSNLLEELKLNYIEGSTQRDPEATLAEAEQLRQELEIDK